MTCKKIKGYKYATQSKYQLFKDTNTGYSFTMEILLALCEEFLYKKGSESVLPLTKA